LLPLLTLQASITPPVVATGGTFQVRTDAGGAGLAQYTLSVDGATVSRVLHDGSLVHEASSEAAQVVAWSAGPSSANWTLQALAPGRHMIGIFVTGEAAMSAGGPFYMTHGSQELKLMVDAAVR
jgi:hypothetical protein